MAANERPGFMIYFDIEPAIEILNDAQLGKLFRAIVEYAHYGVIQDFDDPIIKMAWALTKPNLDRDQKSYEKKIQDNIVKGIKSDFKRNYAPKNGIDPEDEAAMAEYVKQRLSTMVDHCQPQSTTVDQCRRTRTGTELELNSNYNETRTTTLTSTGATAGGVGGDGDKSPTFEDKRESALKAIREWDPKKN